MVGKISRFIGKLTVGRKLALIYLLDLSAVIFISGILINEKYIAIDFSRKEMAGNEYIAVIRDALLPLTRTGAETQGAAAASSSVSKAIGSGVTVPHRVRAKWLARSRSSRIASGWTIGLTKPTLTPASCRARTRPSAIEVRPASRETGTRNRV